MDFLRGLDPIWITLGPILFLNAFFGGSILFFLAIRNRLPIPEEVQRRYSSKYLSAALKHWWYWQTGPVTRFLVNMRLSPNLITFVGILFNMIAGYLFSQGLFGYAGWMMFLGCTFDVFDGEVARRTGQISRSGAFFDSVMDRFSEGAIFLGLAYYFRDSWVLFFVVSGLVGSMLVSYAKARGEAVGIDVKKGSMQRPERIVYIGIPSIFEPLTSHLFASWDFWTEPVIVIAALCWIGIMTNGTAIYRMAYVMNELDEKEGKRAPGITLAEALTKISDPEERVAFLEQVREEFRQKKKSVTEKKSSEFGGD